jgi:hypothetical protein
VNSGLNEQGQILNLDGTVYAPEPPPGPADDKAAAAAPGGEGGGEEKPAPKGKSPLDKGKRK